jgi:hypothetical protein
VAAAPQQDKAQITVAAAIVAEPEAATPLRIQIGPREALPRNCFVRLKGMPAPVSLTEGYSIGPGAWAIPLTGLPTLMVSVPVGISGRSDLVISLLDINGTLLAEAKTTLVIEARAAAAPVERTRTEQIPTGALAPGATVPDSRRSFVAPPIRELAPAERSDAENLLALGKRYLEQGNVAVARQFFRRAANAGLAEGAKRLAATYDPDELARLGAQGVVADQAEAQRWYERARELAGPGAR